MKKKKEIEDELKALPKTYENDAHEVLITLCMKYIADINDHINGYANHPQFQENLRPFMSVLKREIQSTRPMFENLSHGKVEGARASMLGFFFLTNS